MADVVLRPARGLPRGLVIPDAELVERFSRSSGPGGQGVNTTDSRVELRWDVAASTAVSDEQRARLLDHLGHRLVDGVLSIAASEHRSQLQNRTAARARLANYVTEALEPPSPTRRASRPSRRARARRLDAKRHRGEIKAARRRPAED
ncbi:MAG TPA: alternative ribosome rescue aminoacyl-tRNA hydrolase ArfB [Jatrophihabitans sp.]|uniref:alternative ribosome rescue aminoacyl-tRNA hydrolase ArfB n=1 Tax=Jatrophihabitans sp. TaxID=1932789 RepID=UPI002E0575A7|nr:alternative ribosome rescue aminoacyl-tRNA hydrolase ArfB [Jatrophihabitans sp.]